jgi:phosphatidylglycerophosphate synthase
MRSAVLYLPDAVSPDVVALSVGGRALIVRTVIAALRAGVGRIGVPPGLRIEALEAADRRSGIADQAIVWLTAETTPWLDESLLLLPATALVDTAALRALLAAASDRGGAVLEESKGAAAPVAVITPSVVARLWSRLARGQPLGRDLDDGLRDNRLVTGVSYFLPVSDAHLAGEAEVALYERLGIDADSWVDRSFHRRCSRALTRRLARLPITPNQVTMVSLAVGLAGAACIWSASSAGPAVLGLILYAASVVIDHADGELARLTLQESVVGERLDFLSDTAVHALLVIGMGAAADRRVGGGALVLGLVAGAGVILSAIFARRLPVGGGRAERLLKRFGSRDLFYALLLLFVGGLAVAPAILPAVLALAAVGSQAYWLTAMVARLRWRRPHR